MTGANRNDAVSDLARLRALVADDSLLSADRILSSIPDAMRSEPDFAAQAAALHSRLGRHKEAIEALSVLEPGAATDTLALFLDEYLKSKSLYLFFGLYNEMVRFRLVPPKVDALYRRAFHLRINRGSPSEQRLRPRGCRGGLLSLTFEQKWPGLPKDLLGALNGLDGFIGPDLLNPAVFELLCEANGVAEDAKEAYGRKVLQGCYANILFRDVRMVAGRGEFSEDVNEVDRTDFAAALDELKQAGRSVLLVGAHVGLFQMGGSAVRSTVGTNRVSVGVGPPTRENFMSVRNNPERALYYLVRSLKQPGMVGGIAGDGPWGKSVHRTRFLGREIALGLGAPFVIYHTKCQPIWHTTGWKNGGIRTSFALGPTPHADEAYDAWVPRWFEFYVGKLEEVATGDPRNVRGRTGIWHLVAQNFNQELPSRRKQSDAVDDEDDG